MDRQLLPILAWMLVAMVVLGPTRTCPGHEGGGHGSGGHGGGGGHALAATGGCGGFGSCGGGGFRGGFGNRGFGYPGWYGLGWGLGLGSGLGYGFGYPSFGYAGAYPYYAYPPGPYVSGYPASVPQGPAPGAAARITDTDVLLDVRVPPDAVVRVNGTPTTQGGPRREFLSTGLLPGRTYTFVVTARWTGPNGQAVEQQQRVRVRGGERRAVDFLTPPPPDLPPN